MSLKSTEVLLPLRGRLIVSCQAPRGDPFRDPESMARFARAAVEAGAAGIRADGPEDIRAIRRAVDVPVIGIAKQLWTDGRILITPSFDAARDLVEAGARMVALDCTARGRRHGAFERLARIKRELAAVVLADIATVEEAAAAAAAGADAVLSTLRGYTDDTAHVTRFEPDFIAALCRSVSVPVLAEGRIRTPEECRAAIDAGAWAVVVGKAITRPGEIARGFAEALRGAGAAADTMGIDLGGTNTKSGVVAADGRLVAAAHVPTPAGGRRALVDHLKSVVRDLSERAAVAGCSPSALGVATAGWVDPRAGRVVYATENLPGWTGTEIAAELRPVAGLPVAVENDANALAAAEKHFGSARHCGDFVCITLGTGVGGGCYIGGRLNRGSHFFANALGHIPVVPGGLPCTCGLRGCLEAYANAAALVRYAGGAFQSAEQVIAAANSGHAAAAEAVRTFARHLASGLAAMIHTLDPELLVLAGGIAQDNPLLLETLKAELRGRITVPALRNVRLLVSSLGYYAGVYGAAAIAREPL